jgi:hypothetical protein
VRGAQSRQPKTCPSTDYLLDFYHATEHLQSFADANFNDEKQRKDWF